MRAGQARAALLVAGTGTSATRWPGSHEVTTHVRRNPLVHVANNDGAADAHEREGDSQ